MAISYDFDMFSIMPKEVQAEFGAMFQELGMTEQMAQQRALFRDPAAVKALQGASPEARELMIDSGFGINVYDSGAGPGRFPASDGPARARVMEQLMENLANAPDNLDWNGFDIEAFAMAALNAKPLDTPAQSLSAMREAAAPISPAQQPAPQANSVDQLFAQTPPAPQAEPADTGSMDDFFSAKPTAARAAPPQEAGPNMDAFFSNTADTAARSQVSRQMTPDDIRMTIDTSPAPSKGFGFGPVKMALMALGLFVIISMLGEGGGLTSIVEAASGGKMVSVDP